MTDSLDLQSWDGRHWNWTGRQRHEWRDGTSVHLLALFWSSTWEQQGLGTGNLVRPQCSAPKATRPGRGIRMVLQGCCKWCVWVQGWTALVLFSWGHNQPTLKWWQWSCGVFHSFSPAAMPKGKADCQLPPDSPTYIICRPYYPFSHLLALHCTTPVPSYVHLSFLTNQQLQISFSSQTPNLIFVILLLVWCDIPDRVMWVWQLFKAVFP